MLLEYIQNRYRENEPIFLADIDLSVTNNNLRQMAKTLCDKGIIRRYDNGIYYLPGKSRLKGGSSISADEIARYKYIKRNNQVNGYYSGYTFANELGLTTQVPYMLEIVSNQASAKSREISIKNRRILLRKTRVKITKDNVLVLQLLDLLKDIERYADNISDAAVKLSAYIKRLKIRRNDIDKYIGFYPERIYKTIYEMRLYNAFT